jgi:hypothetical protein
MTTSTSCLLHPQVFPACFPFEIVVLMTLSSKHYFAQLSGLPLGRKNQSRLVARILIKKVSLQSKFSSFEIEISVQECMRQSWRKQQLQERGKYTEDGQLECVKSQNCVQMMRLL